MYTLMIILHVLVSLLLMLVILMQASKGGGLSGTFGGSSSTLFGGRGAATFLSKLTTGLAVAFMLISIVIGLMSAPRGKVTSVVKQEASKRTSPSAELPLPQGTGETQPGD